MQPLALANFLAVTVVAISCIPRHPHGLTSGFRANKGRREVAELVAV